MDGEICEICGKKIESTGEILLTVDGKENICKDCATNMAIKAKEENREIEIEYDNGNYIENWYLCTWCEELFPESELREEEDLGHLCEYCIEGIHSRGESLSLKY